MKRLARLLIAIALSTCALHARQATGAMDVKVPATTDAVSVAFAPDGDQIAFVAPVEGVHYLWVHSLTSGTSRHLPAARNVYSSPCWSPDSKSIAYFSENRFMRVDLDGTPAKVLVDSAVRGRGCSWNRDGSILYGLASTRVIWRVSEQGGTQVNATPPLPLPAHTPSLLPNGRHFFFHVAGDGAYLGEIGGAPPKKLLDADAGAIYSRSGHVLFVKNENMYAQKFDLETLTLSGEPSMVDGPVAVNAFRMGVSMSPDGTLLYRSGSGALMRELKWLDRSGRESDALKEPVRIADSPPMLSRDGKFLLVDKAAEGTTDIFTIELATGTFKRMTESPTSTEIYPVWSPDMKTFYFTSNQPGGFDLMERPVDLSAPEKVVMPNRGTRLAKKLSRDGRFMLYRGGTGDIWAIQLDGNPRGDFPVVETKATDDWAEFSPDGRWVVYQSAESGKPEVYLQQFPSGRRIQVSNGGGGHPQWHPEGNELFYLTTNFRMMSVPISVDANTRELVVGKATELFAAPLTGNMADDTTVPQYAVSPDGQRFLFAVMMKVTSPLKVIRNWKPAVK